MYYMIRQRTLAMQYPRRFFSASNWIVIGRRDYLTARSLTSKFKVELSKVSQTILNPKPIYTHLAGIPGIFCLP